MGRATVMTHKTASNRVTTFASKPVPLTGQMKETVRAGPFAAKRLDHDGHSSALRAASGAAVTGQHNPI